MSISVVQHRSTFANGATSVSLAFSSNNAAQNLLLYCAADGGGGASTNACTDNNSNTIANALTVGGACAQRIDYVKSSNSGANTVTANLPASGHPHLHIWEVSGCDTSAPLDQTGSVSGSTTYSVSTSGSTTTANELVVGAFGDSTANETVTIGSGYTLSEQTNNTTGNDVYFTETKIVSSTGTQTATITATGTDSFSQLIATFKASAAVTPPLGDFTPGAGGASLPQDFAVPN